MSICTASVVEALVVPELVATKTSNTVESAIPPIYYEYTFYTCVNDHDIRFGDIIEEYWFDNAHLTLKAKICIKA